MWLALLITGPDAKEWKRKRLLRHVFWVATFMAIPSWLRNNPTENILLGLYVLALTCNITHRRALAAATSKPSSRFWCRLDDLIRLSAVSWPAETLRHARGDKTIDRKRLQWDSSGASPPFQTAWACLHFPLHLLSQSECVFRPLGGERGGEFPGGNFWGEDHN